MSLLDSDRIKHLLSVLDAACANADIEEVPKWA